MNIKKSTVLDELSLKEKKDMLRSIEKSIEQDKKKEKKPKQEIKYKVKDKSKGHYWLILGTQFASIVVWLLIFFAVKSRKMSLLWLILYTVIAIPIFLFAGFGFWIKLYLDRRRIAGAITKAVSHNYIIANFLLENKRKLQVVRPLNPDGKSFNFQEGLYTVDQKFIIKNDKNQPESYYVFDDPSPKNIYQVFNIETDSSIESYSARNLERFRKDKFFEELHRNPNQIDNGILLGALVIIGIIIILVIIFTRGG